MNLRSWKIWLFGWHSAGGCPGRAAAGPADGRLAPAFSATVGEQPPGALAETGLVGFAFFVSWCYVLWQSARFLTRLPDRMMRALGLAGSFVLVGLLIEGFSVDTFALPYYWVSLGLVTAACESARCLLARSPAQHFPAPLGDES